MASYISVPINFFFFSITFPYMTTTMLMKLMRPLLCTAHVFLYIILFSFIKFHRNTLTRNTNTAFNFSRMTIRGAEVYIKRRV